MVEQHSGSREDRSRCGQSSRIAALIGDGIGSGIDSGCIVVVNIARQAQFAEHRCVWRLAGVG
ncbi:hypothetical protein, partial [Escherichia coli]|uniref:hypothetical protein n=1 Tax=Escherichia coli TaxID=562 RepID=UPI001BDCFD53